VSPIYRSPDDAGTVIKKLRSGIFGATMDFDLERIEFDAQMWKSQNAKLESQCDHIISLIKLVRDALEQNQCAEAVAYAIDVGLLYGGLVSKLAIPSSPGPGEKKDGVPAAIKRIEGWNRIPRTKLLKKLRRIFPGRSDENLARQIRTELQKHNKALKK